ncbi:flagellar calcium-binding protein-like [Convolutriloba macropyga]|uniref:flagellar calcium-binding protein-like n=1 Tax=Convolutriloba macropyga TaxID=536237 RepID=UPI003F52020C
MTVLNHLLKFFCLMFLFTIEVVGRANERKARQVDSSSWEDIDWDDIGEKLPLGRNKADRERRKEMFKNFDVNGNGQMAMAEIDKGIRDVLELDQIFDSKSVILRAFQDSKASNAGGNDEYIGKKEFRVFLTKLRQYFEYYVAFNRVDVNQDNRISYTEFVDAVEKMEEWVGNIDDVDAEFKKVNWNSSSVILFEEFVDWAIVKDLDLEDDDD